MDSLLSSPPQHFVPMARCVALGLLFFSALSPASGQTDSETTPPVSGTVHEKLVVTAARIEERARVVPANVTVLDGDDLAQSAALTVDDALRRVPGFSLFRRASSVVSHPTTQGVSLRGIGPSGVSRTLVLLDGVPLNDAFGGWVYWSRVSTESLERVELVRGGASNVWGSSALGGVIQLITTDPSQRALSLAARVGDRSTYEVDLFVGRQRERASWSLQGNAFDTGGYPVLAPEQRGAIDIAAFSEHLSLGARATHQAGPQFQWSLAVDGFEEERGNGTPLTGNETDFLAAVLRVDGIVGGGELFGSVFFHDQEFSSTFSSQADDRASENPALNQFLVPSDGVSVSLQWSRSFARQEIVAGIEQRFIDGETNEEFFFTGFFNRRRQAGGDQEIGGLFLQDHLELGERWHLTLGTRLDRWRSTEGRRLETEIADGSVRLEEIYDDREKTTVSPKLGLLWARDEFQWFASAYRSFRAPTINELYRPFRVGNDITAANALLDPETLEGLETGIRWQQPQQGVEATAFWNEVSDPVANVSLGAGPGVVPPCGFVPGGGSCRQRQNLGLTRIRGIEIESWHRFGESWRSSLGYLFSDSTVRRAANSPDLEGLRVAQVPRHQLSAEAQYEGSSIGLGLEARYASDQFEDDLNDRRLEHYTVVNLSVTVPVKEILSLFVQAENLFDEEIEVGLSGNGLRTIGTPRLVRGGVRLRLAP